MMRVGAVATSLQSYGCASNILLTMARFQAMTSKGLDDELEMLRDRLGLEANQKADLLREVTSLAAWVVRQSERGRVIEARRGKEVELLAHPALDRLVTRRTPRSESWVLSDEEVVRLAAILDRPFDPPPALRKALAHLANPRRRLPKLRWPKSAA